MVVRLVPRVVRPLPFIVASLLCVPFAFALLPALDDISDAALTTASLPVPLPNTGVLPATVGATGNAGTARSWPAFDGEGNPTGVRSWRAFTVGGNCCEHYLATTPDGWIVNLGATFPTFSKNDGASWQNARPSNPMLGAEGAVSAAPGGDVVGMTWDPYTGDQVVAYKYEKDTDRWYWNLVNLHEPFFDRPWLSVAPGPFRVGELEIPYVVFLRGGLAKYPQFMSVDGLHYAAVDPSAYALVGSVVPVDGVTVVNEMPDFGVAAPIDHLQPHPSAFGTPLPNGGYLAAIPHTADMHAYAVLGQDLVWRALDVDLPSGELFFDSAGNIHNIKVLGNAWLDHRLSKDGGATWTEYRYQWDDASIQHWEFKVDGNLGLAVILVHQQVGLIDRDVVYKVWDYATDLAPDEMLMVGAGDTNFGSGLSLTGGPPRFDFTTLGILPDGRVVAAFADSQYRPGFAIEQASTGAFGGWPVDV